MTRQAKARFVARLKQAIEDAGYISEEAPKGIGPLARNLNPRNPESAERNLHRWLDPANPNLPRRAARESLARVLWKDADFFEPRTLPVSTEHIERIRALVTAAERKAKERAWEWVS